MGINWFPHWRSIESGGGYIKSVTLEDHEQALAEKDREIQQIREHEYQRGYQEGEAVMLAQAVRFATYLRETIDSSDIGGLGMYEQVQAFLKEHP